MVVSHDRMDASMDLIVSTADKKAFDVGTSLLDILGIWYAMPSSSAVSSPSSSSAMEVRDSTRSLGTPSKLRSVYRFTPRLRFVMRRSHVCAAVLALVVSFSLCCRRSLLMRIIDARERKQNSRWVAIERI